MNTSRISIEQLTHGVTSGDRIMLAKAITLIESALPSDQKLAGNLIDKVISKTGNALRIGITGTPGVGKSTFIERFGKHIIEQGKSVAVLTIDPSSQRTKGSILGDKTRMEELSKNPMAFIRPSPAGSTLGGVAARTRETMLLCEAAGFDVIIIETVGVGQSEISVKSMVDFFLLLMLAGAGDELQGIKKGIIEMADAIAITKADGDNLLKVKEAQAEYQQAFHLLPANPSGWIPKVVTCSALSGAGVEDIWKMILQFQQQAIASGYFENTRQSQRIAWFQEDFNQLLQSDYKQFQDLLQKEKEFDKLISDQKISSRKAAQEMIALYHQSIRNNNS